MRTVRNSPERALRKLYEKGLIFFFRVPARVDIGASADEEAWNEIVERYAPQV